tara:strand:- start:2874 stop:3047 length:174 start_codon:yes stop_codon:yes gene_type:complete
MGEPKITIADVTIKNSPVDPIGQAGRKSNKAFPASTVSINSRMDLLNIFGISGFTER